jgi:hypothetical protein
MWDHNALLSILYLARHNCDGNFTEASMRWLVLNPVLGPRVALTEARRHPATADAVLGRYARAGFGSASSNSLWMCSVIGGLSCYDAAHRVMTQGNASEDDRVAAVWTWTQLAWQDLQLDELRRLLAREPSPQVRETAGYGFEYHEVRAQQQRSQRCVAAGKQADCHDFDPPTIAAEPAAPAGGDSAAPPDEAAPANGDDAVHPNEAAPGDNGAPPENLKPPGNDDGMHPDEARPPEAGD